MQNGYDAIVRSTRSSVRRQLNSVLSPTLLAVRLAQCIMTDAAATATPSNSNSSRDAEQMYVMAFRGLKGVSLTPVLADIMWLLPVLVFLILRFGVALLKVVVTPAGTALYQLWVSPPGPTARAEGQPLLPPGRADTARPSTRWSHLKQAVKAKDLATSVSILLCHLLICSLLQLFLDIPQSCVGLELTRTTGRTGITGLQMNWTCFQQHPWYALKLARCVCFCIGQCVPWVFSFRWWDAAEWSVATAKRSRCARAGCCRRHQE